MSVRVFENDKFTHNKETLVKKNKENMSQWEQLWFSWATARQIQLICWAAGVCFRVSLKPKFSVVQLEEDVNYTLPIRKTQRRIQGISVPRARGKDALRREGDRKPCTARPLEKEAFAELSRELYCPPFSLEPSCSPLQCPFRSWCSGFLPQCLASEFFLW